MKIPFIPINITVQMHKLLLRNCGDVGFIILNSKKGNMNHVVTDELKVT